MKLVVAVIQPTKLEAVREALAKVEVERMTIRDAQGFGHQRNWAAPYRGFPVKTGLLREIAMEIVVNDDFLPRTIETVAGLARRGPDGAMGDGKIFVLPVEQAIKIKDGARGPGAV